MKTLISTILLLLIVLTACEPKPDNVVFHEPQPAKLSNENRFSKHYQGTYQEVIFAGRNKDVKFLSKDLDTGYQVICSLFITPDKITKKSTYSLKIARREITDSLLKGKTDAEIIKLCLKDGWNQATFKKDTLEVTQYKSDTLFDMAAGDVLKYFRGSYFLNLKKDYGWKLKRLTLKRGSLSLSHPYIEDSLATAFQEITPLDAQKAEDGKIESYSISPDKKSFKKLLNNDFFGSEGLYLKIRD